MSENAQGVRSLSATCEDDCRLGAIGVDAIRELAAADPRVGFLLFRVVAGFALDGRAGTADGAPRARAPRAAAARTLVAS